MTKEELKNRKIALYIKDLIEDRKLNELNLRAIVVFYLANNKEILCYYNLQQILEDNGIKL